MKIGLALKAADFDCGFCETDTVLGRKGFCNFTSSVPFCECPEGFSGQDDWMLYSGCQVNNKLRSFFHIISVGLSLLGLVVCLVCILLLLRKWKFKVIPRVFTSRTDSEHAEKYIYQVPSFSKYVSKAPHLHALAIRNWKRRVSVLNALIVSIGYFVGSLLANVPFVFNEDQDRSDNPLIVFGFYLMFVTSFIVAFLMMSIWKNTLPDISKYGDLLEMNQLLVRFPTLVETTNKYNTIALITIYTITIVIIPLTIEDKRILHWADVVSISTLIYAITSTILIFYLLIITVEKVFHKAIDSHLAKIEEGNDQSLIRQEEIKFMQSALQPIKSAKVSNMTVMVLNLLSEVVCVFTGITRIYFFHGLVFFSFVNLLVTLPISFVMMEDRLTPAALKTTERVNAGAGSTMSPSVRDSVNNLT